MRNKTLFYKSNTANNLVFDFNIEKQLVVIFLYLCHVKSVEKLVLKENHHYGEIFMLCRRAREEEKKKKSRFLLNQCF